MKRLYSYSFKKFLTATFLLVLFASAELLAAKVETPIPKKAISLSKSTNTFCAGCLTSDIVVNNSFAYPTNIDYALTTGQNNQTSNITSTTGTTMAEFQIRDGGAGGSDAGSETTTLTDLTLTFTNASFIRRVALYDAATGLVEYGEVAPSGSTATFSGLPATMFAPDNGSFSFQVKVSFNTTVTDQQRITASITAATADVLGSVFINGSAGGATTNALNGVSGSNNVVNVIATKLVFTTQPPSTTRPNVNVTPQPVVTAEDANNNTDVDYNTAYTVLLLASSAVTTG